MIEQAADERAAVQKPSPLFRGEGHARTWQAFRENVAAFLPRDPSGAQGESRKAESAGRHDLLRFLPLIAVFLARRRSHRNDPAGTTTISAEFSHSRDVFFGFNPGCRAHLNYQVPAV
jgi:hypothetical protein